VRRNLDVLPSEAHIPRFADRTKIGDQWTFVAIDPDTKLIPAYRVGKRTRETAVAFMTDLSERLSNRVQISSDSLRSYVDAVERAFGADVGCGQMVKFYDACAAERDCSAQSAGQPLPVGFRTSC
jgi:transposase-like protein